MTAEAGERGAEELGGSGTIARLVNALELIGSAHASRARDEAKRDASRLVSGLLLGLVAVLLVIPAVAVADVAAALALAARGVLSLPSALAAAAAIDALVVVALVLAARARFTSPVLVETRATLKRAALVLRGS